MHNSSEPNILYFGTPVVLISTCNEDGTPNLAPISSVFWLGWRCVIGISAFSKTTENIRRTGECVLNLPSVNQVEAVNRLALTTGTFPVPVVKEQRGYRYVADKFALAGLTQIPSETVSAPRVNECPVQMEVMVENLHVIMSFQKFYGLGDQIHSSALSSIPEHLYRSPDVDKAKAAGKMPFAVMQ
jgi:flavin reductase (DIM6/NTAB) family NADH-FMN oxidoreductase RutF